MTIDTRNFKIFLISLAAIAVIGIGYNQLKDTTPKNLITYKDPQLTDQEKQGIQKQLDDAEAALKNLPANASGEQRYRGYMQVGLINYELGQYSKAQEVYKEAQKLDPNNPIAYHELFVVENAMHDYGAAKTDIEKAVQLAANNPQYWRDRVELVRNHFNPTNSEIEKLYQDALTATNNSVDVITSYAQFLEEKGDLQGAVTQWKAAIDKNPSATTAYQQEIERIQANLR